MLQPYWILIIELHKYWLKIKQHIMGFFDIVY